MFRGLVNLNLVADDMTAAIGLVRRRLRFDSTSSSPRRPAQCSTPSGASATTTTTSSR